MTTNDSDDLKFGVNWGFLKSLLAIYEDMLLQQQMLIRAKAGCAGMSPRVAYANLCSSVYTFFTAVESQFDNYLENVENVKPSDYINIINTVNVSDNKQDYNKLLTLSRHLSLWSTREGVFKTLTDKYNPDEAW